MSEPDESPQQTLARLQAELAAARRQLDAAQAALGSFAWAVGHDLRAHLRHITAYSGLLREEWGGALPAQAAAHLETVTRAARLLGQQMDGLLAWSQLERAELRPTALDLPLLIKEARHALAAQEAQRAIDWRVAADLPVARGDAVLVRQVLQHLLSNALKFTRRTAPAVIEIGAQGASQAGHCELFVRDNGAGFDPRAQDKLFHVFQRLHPAGEFEGLGLGLALARKIVERHGGVIRAEGAPGAGCCVRFTLPSGP